MKCHNETVSEDANGSGLAAMKEGAEKWNTSIIFKRCIILKNEGYFTVCVWSIFLIDNL